MSARPNRVTGEMSDLPDLFAQQAAAVQLAAVGDAAVDAVHDALAAGRDDPLAPAVVVCDAPLRAVALRRALAARQGYAAVDVITTEGLLDRLVLPWLTEIGHRPASRLEVLTAVAAELAERPGRFGRVANHRATAERLLRLERLIAGLDRDDLARLEDDPTLGAEAVGVLRRAAKRLGRARTRGTLVDVAVERLDAVATGSWGPIVLFLPDPSSVDEARLFAALARRHDVTIVVGQVGDEGIDRGHLERLAGWGVVPPSTTRRLDLDAPTARRLEAADPDDEVRAALRSVSAWAASGTPLNRIAVLYPSADPYATLLFDRLTEAGLPHCGPGHRPLSRSLAGRTLLRLLRLRADGLERSAVIALLSGAPLVDGAGRSLPVAAWDRLSRQAGVIDGDDWRPRLEALAGGLEATEPGAAEAARGLADFVDELDTALHPEGGLDNWWAWGHWAAGLLRSYLPTRAWPDAERRAFDRIVSTLERLRVLDQVATSSTETSHDSDAFAAVFAETIASELDAGKVPGIPLGPGLVVAPIDAVAGLAFDRVVVVGAAEGVWPRTPRPDSLLPDQARARLRVPVPASSDLTDLDIRTAAVAVAASRNPALITTSRGDLRSNRARHWPRVLDPVIDPDADLVLASHHQGLASHARPESEASFSLRSLIAHVDRDEPVDVHPAALGDPVLSAGLTRWLERRRPELTTHSGRVAAGSIDPTTKLLSPTALEDYASCPRRYLFARVLRIAEEERPERIDEITPRDRGTLVHAILERFVQEAIDSDAVPSPDVPWSAAQVSRLLAIGEEEIETARAQGITGGRVQTELLRRAVERELYGWLTLDAEIRSELRSRPHATEWEFGFGEERRVTLADGRSFPMRGYVDRVDLTDDGGVVVIDYKGGSGAGYAKMAEDPLKSGQRLQLPLYARVLADQLDLTGPRTALYWLTKGADRRDMVLDADLDAELDRLLGAALDGIAAGLFPGLPGEATAWPRASFDNCKWCDFDRICPTDRQAEWDRVADDSALTPIDLLLGRGGDEGPGGAR